VKLWLADGDREDDLAGAFVRYDGADWPIPVTHWESLALDAATSGTARSLNDGSLALAAPDATTTQPYPTVPSLPTASDPQSFVPAFQDVFVVSAAVCVVAFGLSLLRRPESSKSL